MLSGALGTTAMLAGCLGDDDDDGDGNGNGTDDGNGNGIGNGNGTVPDGAHVEGQELIMSTHQNPEETHFVPQHDGAVGGALETDLSPDDPIRPALFGTGMWGRVISPLYGPDPGELHPGLFEDFTLEPQTMTITIQEDTGWSDGEPLRAFDIAGMFAAWSTSDANPGENPYLWAEEPAESGFFPVQDIEMPDGPDGKVVEFHNYDWDEYPAWEEVNGFEFPDYGNIYFHLLGPQRRRAACLPTHVEPWKTFVEERWEWRQDHKLGSDDPRPHPMTFGEHAAEVISVEDLEATREEGGIPTCGAWQLEEVRGAQEIVLKPNEHHYAADEINFDRVRFDWNQEPRRERSGIHAGNLDYASVSSSPEEVQSYPSKYEQLKSPMSEGHAIGIDHSTAFGDVRVRQAMMFAMNTEDIALNVHPDARRGIQIPGYDNFASDAVITEEWAEENLIDYTQDLDRAEELMLEAGFERNSDDVWERDGEPLTTEIATPADVPVWEETVSQQLSSFGIDINVRTMDGATFEERWVGSDANEYIEEEYGGNGDFDLWNAGIGAWFAGYYEAVAYGWNSALNHVSRVRAFNMYDHDAQEEALLLTDEEDYDGYGPSGWAWACAPSCHMEFTIDIPPIGEPDGEREPFNPQYLDSSASFAGTTPESPFEENPYYNPPHNERHPENADYFWKKLMWTFNYHLPFIPIALAEQQHFLNTENWVWPTNDPMWEYFGLGWDARTLSGSGKIWADPENPKDGAEPVE